MPLSRRNALKLALFGGAATLLPLERTLSAATALQTRLPAAAMPVPFTTPFTIPPVATPVRTDATTDYYKIYMNPFTAEIAPGLQTQMWGYNSSFPGPTVMAKQGRQTVIRHVNNLPATHPALGYAPWTSVHLHGMPSLPEYDGYASDVTNPQQYKDYHYPNSCTARTLWYHDHGVSHTAENVSMGLAAQYILTDPVEQALPIPHGAYDIPLVIHDVMLADDGQILWDNHDSSGMYGDIVLVNGKPWPVMKVARRKYRFRFLNASISRSYNYFLSTGDTFTMIGTDGGLMAAPVKVKQFKQGMAERYEVVIDFAKYPVGQRIVLGNKSPKNNVLYPDIDKIMAFDVVGDSFDPSNNKLPAVLAPAHPAMLLQAADAVKTRQFNLVRTGGKWTINGKTWDDVVKSGFTYTEANPNNGDAEIWEISNPSGGWFHPLHVHLVDFQVLSRNGKPPFPYERGPKDVVYVGENETVRLLMRFEGRGKYMIHCHNLVHEDHDMMTQFEVIDPVTPADDPLGDPCWDLPESVL